ncbi:MAG: TIGR01777 family oxidoreductase [Anaerolineales bacterium]|nr:TIGR01777 family oxidoreductase [Anaerolineales bacterium]
MKIVIPGGSGQVGTVLARAFHSNGHEVVTLSRSPGRQPWRSVYWDGITAGPWMSELERADALINLAGFTVNCRYNQTNRAAILGSRVLATRALGEAYRRVDHPPSTWLQASTATIYSHRFDAPNDEATGLLGGSEPEAPETWRFSIRVAKAWEKAFCGLHLPATRRVILRSALILSPDRGGIFDALLRLVRFGLGGRQGSGRQFVSWIHYEDFINAVYWLINQKSFYGIVNLAAPNPLPNQEFMQALRAAWGAPVGLPASRWMLEVGAVLMQTETELILKSRRVAPGRLAERGFSFQYPTWPKAARDLCSQWQAQRHILRNALSLS